ncbi:hypothetical protein Nepgr_010155 [Nepenthes gracilis]|uniref:CAP-Gly domain-containing linker protein 1 n=1 Tax=Nepenthes gracilis TaxID=150966 RepID=A0AAD3SBW2_NEPGR|nr:hypothetical protein Nepgr_010155 [Nepenthes gracilis]
MATADSTSPSVAAVDHVSSAKENRKPINSRLAELNESRAELMHRLQSLKQDLQNWRSKLDTQVKIYREELADLKKSLDVEVEQIRTEFQDLRTTLQKQHEDVTASLRNLGLQDCPSDGKAAEEDHTAKEEDNVQDDNTKASCAEKFSNNGGNDAENSKIQGNNTEAVVSTATGDADDSGH